MPSILTHAFVAGSLGATFPENSLPKRAIVAGIVCGILPDIDTLGHLVGIPLGSAWGHRGITHSLLFALAVSVAAAGIVGLSGRSPRRWAAPWPYLLLCIASHGVLDAMTNAGAGVAFLEPFSDRRFFLPWHPIVGAPLNVSRLIGMKGIAIAVSEVRWVWIPMLVLVLIVREARQRRAKPAPG
jgi:inner membrane protein